MPNEMHAKMQKIKSPPNIIHAKYIIRLQYCKRIYIMVLKMIAKA